MDQWMQYGLSKKGTSLYYPFDMETPVLRVGSKMFALFSTVARPSSVNLKCDPLRACALREEYPEIVPGYHMNKKHWNTVQLDGNLTDAEIQALIDHSYELVFKSLTKSERLAITEKLSS